MDRSGLPIPAGGSESLLALLLRLNTQGLRLSDFSLPTQTRAASSNSPVAEHMTVTPNAVPSNLLFNAGFLNYRNSGANFLGSNSSKLVIGNLACGKGRVAQRLQEYMSCQRNKPEDNNIQFWRNLVAEFFAPNAKMRWCVSHYKNCRQIERIFSKGLWQCDMCNEKPCRSLEISGEVLPRLHKMKYDMGMLEERLHIEKPSEYQCATGEIVLHYAHAVEEVEYGQAHILRFGQLRVIFSPDLKIVSWEFCAKLHKENIHQRSMVPQAGQLGAALQNYQANTQGASSVPLEDLQKNSEMFVSSANQKVEALGASYICQIGIAKPYMRYLQTSEVLNIMNDLVVYSQKERLAPRESMAKFPRFGSNSSTRRNLNEQSEQKKAPSALPAPNVPAFTGMGNGSGFSISGLGNANTTSPTFIEPINQKRQRTNPKEVEYIDVENTLSRNNDTGATTSGLAPRGQTNMDMVPRDSKSNYLDELDDYLLNELDLEALHEFLNS